MPLTGLIDSQGSAGGSYSFVDEEVVNGTTYQYLLVERKTDGTLIEYQNQVVTVVFGAAPQLDQRLYLPLIVHTHSIEALLDILTPTLSITFTQAISETATLTVTE